MKTIGDLIKSNDDARQKSAASAKAALDASKQATDDKASLDTADVTLAKGLAQTGPVTVDNHDGTFSLFEPSTTAPGYRVETSKGIEAEVADDPDPAPVEPEPVVEPVPVESIPTI